MRKAKNERKKKHIVVFEDTKKDFEKMKVYGDVTMVKDDENTYNFYDKGIIIPWACAEVDFSGQWYATFKGEAFTACTKVDLCRKIKLYFCKTVKIEISKAHLNMFLVSEETLSKNNLNLIKGKELIDISVKYGTNSQTLITEWV